MNNIIQFHLHASPCDLQNLLVVMSKPLRQFFVLMSNLMDQDLEEALCSRVLVLCQ